jgi:acyl-CoA thioesterase-1
MPSDKKKGALLMNRSRALRKTSRLVVGAFHVAGVLCGTAHAAADAGSAPRVLIIGDSIAMGYWNAVATELKGVAVVVKNPGNAGPAATALAKPADAAEKNAPKNAAGETPDPAKYETNLDYYLAFGPFDVIHFNWGLHDLKRGGIPKDLYIVNLTKLVDQMKEAAPNARLIFATTTPVPPVNNEGRIPEKVVEFNEAAVALMKGRGVEVNDLYAAVLPRQAEVQLKDNVHFGKDGCALLANQVAMAIKEALKADGRKGPGAPEKVAPAAGVQSPVSKPADVTPKVESPRSQEAQPAAGSAAGAKSVAMAPAGDAAKDLAKLVKYTVEPAMEHKLNHLKLGAIQHCDRPYVYSVIPEEMVGAVVFQGVHRAPLGTKVKIEVLASSTVYFFFYHGGKYSGGYDKIFPDLKDWRKLDADVRYGHNVDKESSKIMRVYRLDAQAGLVEIPATTSENGVFAFAVKAME